MLQEVPGEKLVYAAATIAVGLAGQLELSEINVLANFLTALGDNLSVIAAQREAASEASGAGSSEQGSG